MKYAAEIAFGLGISVFFFGVVSWRPLSRAQSGAKAAAKLQVTVLLKYIESEKRHDGDYPTEIQTISDPWGIPYTYSLTYGAPRICSLGPDRLAATGDDICAP